MAALPLANDKLAMRIENNDSYADGGIHDNC